MSYSKLRYRRGAMRLASVLASTALVGTGAVAFTGVAYAEESTPEVTLETFDASDFTSQASELPDGLQTAIERDLNISPAEYLANAEATKRASEVAAALRADGVEINSIAVDGQEVTYYVAAEADVELVASVGAKVEVGEPETPEYDDKYYILEDLRGGYGYIGTQGDSFAGRCSVGFNGFDSSGNHRYLSAGHCGLDLATGEDLGEAWHLDVDDPIGNDGLTEDDLGAPIGEIVEGSNNFGFEVYHDGGLVDVTGESDLTDVTGDWANVPQVSEWDGGAGDPTVGSVTIYDTVEPAVGADVCSSGATTGWTCGEVESLNETWRLHDHDGNPVADVTGFVFDACVLGGDSGGSIVTGNYALGVNSGGTPPPGNDCENWDPGTHVSLGYAVSGGDYNALDLYGSEYELNVAVNTPEVSANADADGATITGSVEHGGSDHRVQVSVAGVGDYEADLDADGEFAIEVDETLEVGTEYTYTAQAFYGQFSQSEAAEGSFTVEEAPEVAELVVDSPSDGQTTSNARPPFEGSGEPGAEVTLSVGDDEFGGATVNDEGAWEITPESDLPRGQRFDATITQVAGDDEQSVTITDLGIRLPEVMITAPEDGSEVGGDVVFEGTSFAGAEVGLILRAQGEGDADSEPTAAILSEDGAVPADEDEDMAVWEGEFDIDEDGNWTFVPDEELAEGAYTVTAMATAEGDAELTDSEHEVSFTVVARDDDGGDEGGNEDGGDEDGGDEDLPDTGAGNLTMILIGAALLAAGGGALALRARRNGSNA